MQTVMQKWGNSQGIRIPKHILEIVKISVSDSVEISTEDDRIIIKKAQNNERKTIEELFANFNGEYITEEVEWGTPQGKEVW